MQPPRLESMPLDSSEGKQRVSRGLRPGLGGESRHFSFWLVIPNECEESLFALRWISGHKLPNYRVDRCVSKVYSSKRRTGEFMLEPKITKNNGIVISALRARANFGRLLQRLEKDTRGLVIEKRGTPRAILLSIRDYVRLAAPEPEILRAIGEESRRKRTNTLTSRQIDRIIKKARARKTKRRKTKPRESSPKN